MADGPIRIAHLSDLHCGGQYFEPTLLERAIAEINDLKPDIVICTGDLTTLGFRHEYLTAREYFDRLDCDALVVVEDGGFRVVRGAETVASLVARELGPAR